MRLQSWVGDFVVCWPGRCPDGYGPCRLHVEHPECALFGPKYDQYVAKAITGSGTTPHQAEVSALTNAVAALLPKIPPGSRTDTYEKQSQAGSIDSYIFGALQAAGVQPAPATTDYEFIRRVTLDLTGRIPTPARVATFVADGTPDKRSKLVDELMAKPEWIDKWTMFFGDLYQNNSQNSQIRRYPEGVKAFNNYIRASLTANKPYDQMAREMICATGTNSYTQGELNLVVGGVVTGGPIQDDFDQQTANIATMFLGMSHVNCLLCHNGRGHLDALSLWGSQTTRYQAWQLASYLSHTQPKTRPVDPGAAQPAVLLERERQHAGREDRLSAEHHHRQPSGAAARRHREERAADVHSSTATHRKPARATAPRWPARDRRSAICARHRQLHLGVLLRRRAGGSARSVRPGAARSRQSAARAVDAAASNPQLLNALALDSSTTSTT